MLSSLDLQTSDNGLFTPSDGDGCRSAERPRLLFLTSLQSIRYFDMLSSREEIGGFEYEDTAENPLRAGDCSALYFCLVLFRPALLYRLGLRNFLRPDRYLGNSGSGNLFSKERHHSSGDCFPGKSCWHSHGCGVAAGHHPADQVCNTGQSLSIIRLSAKDERCEPPAFFTYPVCNT